MRYQVYEKDDLVMTTDDLDAAKARYRLCYAYGRLGGIIDTSLPPGSYRWVC